MKEEWVLNQSQGVASSHKIVNAAEILSLGYVVLWDWCSQAEEEGETKHMLVRSLEGAVAETQIKSEMWSQN